MKTIRSALGYGWAFLALPLLLATFIGMNHWSTLLARATGVTVSPWITGGPVTRTLPHPGYETRIHRPVFDGLWGQRAQGFVQVDWVPRNNSSALPAEITEEIDYNADGQPDFRVQFNNQTAAVTVTPLSPRVLGLNRVFHLSHNRSLRVTLRRDPR
jgi:hypothetical protein